MNIQLGTSGYQYDDFQDIFYPEGLGKEYWLDYYCDHFDTVEINNTFYNLLASETAKKWKDQTPDDFTFSVKASRYITHMKKLNLDDDLRDALDKFYSSIQAIRKKTKCILWQLPANLHADVERLKDFLRELDQAYENVFEFRHKSWFSKSIYQCLHDHSAICCTISCPDESLPEQVFAEQGKAYLRMHGISDWYEGEYKNDQLKDWYRKLKNSNVEEGLIYFNNTKEGSAVKNALRMKKQIEQEFVLRSRK